jgi:2-oxoglutarate ferredoxin oxidoreductase subunit alpha
MLVADKVLMKGNEALAEAAIRAGCRFYAGYPITPQNEVPEYMSSHMFAAGGQFIQAESEIAAINMLYGAGGAGIRVMTSSSSPGISLKQEGISYLAGAEVPAVIVNMARGGPGLGGIQPAQSDYFQATKGGGHGDYRLLVLAPESVQEMVDLVGLAFDRADRYRTPVMLLGDAIVGQIMEPVALPQPIDPATLPAKPWATTGTGGTRRKNIINSLYLNPDHLEQHNLRLQAKYAVMDAAERRWTSYQVEDAETVVVAYGSMARIARRAVDMARAAGVKVGIVRPISLWPFPVGGFAASALPLAKRFLAVEMSYGQMVEDVRLAINCRLPVHFFGRAGGVVPTPDEVLAAINRVSVDADPTGPSPVGADGMLGGDAHE